MSPSAVAAKSSWERAMLFAVDAARATGIEYNRTLRNQARRFISQTPELATLLESGGLSGRDADYYYAAFLTYLRNKGIISSREWRKHSAAGIIAEIRDGGSTTYDSEIETATGEEFSLTQLNRLRDICQEFGGVTQTSKAIDLLAELQLN